MPQGYHILKSLKIFLIILACLTQIQTTALSKDPDSFLEVLYEQFNEVRESRGLKPLKRSRSLGIGSKLYAKKISLTGKFQHAKWLNSNECLAWSNERAQFDAIEVWLNSPGHRAIILDTEISKVGIGFARAKGGVYVVLRAK